MQDSTLLEKSFLGKQLLIVVWWETNSVFKGPVMQTGIISFA